MTNVEEVIKYIEKNGSITAIEAIELGITYLGGYIYTIRRGNSHIKARKIYTKREAYKNKFGKTVYFTRYAFKKNYLKR